MKRNATANETFFSGLDDWNTEADTETVTPATFHPNAPRFYPFA